jgi:hypothetical protein
MAGGGIGEAALISAAIGGATSAATGGDPLRGAVLGGITGGLTSGIGGLIDQNAANALAGADVGASSIMGGGVTPVAYTPSAVDTSMGLRFDTLPDVTNASNFGQAAASSLYTPPTPTTSMGPGLATAPQPSPSFGDQVSNFLKSGRDVGIGTLALTGGGAGLAESMRAERDRYGMPPAEKYEGPLSKFSYDPRTYTPYTYRPYAEGGLAALAAGGGPVEMMSNANAVGANTGFPMANIARGAYATPYQQPISQNVLSGSQDTRVDPYTGQERLAGGGLSDLGAYSDGGRLLRGPGDGVSDSIPAMIGNKQPARLADGEFVVPARIVSEIGNGSTDAGARELYKMMDRVQSARGKTTGKGRVAKDTRATKYLPA